MKTKIQPSFWHAVQMIPTRREYLVFFSSVDNQPPVRHSLKDILTLSIEKDHEFAHSLLEDLDKLLDLGIMQSMNFYPNRDDVKNPYRELAIIKRVR